ncbi:MAG: DUF4340 domain-containing protein, partial [Pseudomonadota bacterium]
MRNVIFFLGGLLALQLLVALFLSMGGSNNAAFEAKEPLLSVAVNDVQEITITGAQEGAEPVRIVRAPAATDGSSGATADSSANPADGPIWQVASAHDFPAQPRKVTDLLTTLGELKKGWAVAESSSAHERLKVADDAFERRVVIKTSNGEETVFLGTSPLFKRVYARPADDNAVYTVAMSAFDADAVQDNWLERNKLNFDLDAVTSISGPSFTLVKAEQEKTEGETDSAATTPAPEWSLSDVPEGREVDGAKIQAFVNRFRTLNYASVAGPGSKAAELIGQPSAQYSIEQGDGEIITLQITMPPQESGDGVVATTPAARAKVFASSQPFVFEFARSVVEPLASASMDGFLAALPEPEVKSDPEPAVETADESASSAPATAEALDA